MRGTRIGSAFGIPIKLDLTFLIVLPPSAWLIDSDVTNLTAIVNDLFGSTVDNAAISVGSVQQMLGSAAAIGLLAGVLLHGLDHSLVVVRCGYKIESITLQLFGDVTRLKEIPEGWKREFTITVAGLVISVTIDVASYAGFLLLPELQAPAQFVLGCLTLVNVSLAVSNMLPGFPTDDGRVLRALLVRNRLHVKVMQMAAEVDEVFAFLLDLFGLFFNLFLVALAFFIYMGAPGETQQIVLKVTFQDMVVRDIMAGRENLDVVDEKTSIAELFERMFVEHHTGYPMLRNGDLVSMIILDDARGVKEVERGAFRVDDIINGELTTITPGADAMGAIAFMQERSVGRLPVADETGELVGLVSRSSLVITFNTIRSRGSLDATPRSDAGLAQLC